MRLLNCTLGLFLAYASSLVAADRTIIRLDGDWQIADSISAAAMPQAFPARVPVPGLVHLATPAFQDVDLFDGREFIEASIREKKLPESARVVTAGIPRQIRNYFWYQRTFQVDKLRAWALLRVGKAQFGTAVWVNGVKAGEHLGCFTAGIFEVGPLLKLGANVVVIRVGAHPAVLPVWVPTGSDYEKYRWTPGIYDSVTLSQGDWPRIESVQVAPRLAAMTADVEVELNPGRASGPLGVTAAVTKGSESPVRGSATIDNGIGVQKLKLTLDLKGAHLWTPENPFLYTLHVATDGDSLDLRFGMREFRFDTPTKRAYLNGKLYFLRGSNVTLHRFFEDPNSGGLPWNREWVTKLLKTWPKRMNWNSFRFCIGPVPDMWLDIADEAGLLIQNEYFIWNGKDRFPPYSTEELTTEYSEWMRDNWNHPSVAIWDATNETEWPLLRDTIIPAVRKLDLSNRPWDDGYATPGAANDGVEDHPYLFSDSNFDIKRLEKMTGAQSENAPQPTAHAAIINEYGWLWLRRDGTPTLLTEKVYEKQLGKDATPRQRFELYAYYLSGLTEFWRAHRNFAGVLHFNFLTCDYPGVKTGDHWRNIEQLELEPNFADWVRESFKPLGLYINFWQPTLTPSAKRTYAVMMVNDEGRDLRGTLSLSFERDGQRLSGAAVPFEIPAYGAQTWQVPLEAPSTPGAVLLKASALADQGNEPTVSRRKIDIR